MKGGTSILYDFICSHPGVTRASKKEIHFFSLYYHNGMDWYLEHFTDDGLVTGEASPTYFDIATSAQIPELIDTSLPESKLILIVRDPVERAVSHFNHLQFVNKLSAFTEMSAEDFFRLPYEVAVRQTTDVEYHLHQVLSFSCYYRRFLFYRQVFQDRLLVIGNAALRSDGQQTMNAVFGFLGLEPIESDLFGTTRYVHGSERHELTLDTRARLTDYFDHDLEQFLAASGLDTSALAHGA